MIVQFSTGGRGRGAEQRGSMLHLKPDMASLATGSVNFPSMIYENPPELIDSLAAAMIEPGIKPECEIFDLAMLYAAAEMVKDGRLKRPATVQFVFGPTTPHTPKRERLEAGVGSGNARVQA